MGNLAGKIIEGVLKEMVASDFDISKIMNIGSSGKGYITMGRAANQMPKRQYGASTGNVNGAESRSYPGPGAASAAQALSGTEPVTGTLNYSVDRRATTKSREGLDAPETVINRTFAVSRSPIYRDVNTDGIPSGTQTVTGAASNKTFAVSKSQGSKNGKAASADNSGSGKKMQPTAIADTDTIQPILLEEKDGPGFQLKLDDQSLLNGFVLSEILGKPKYLRRGRW